MIRPRVLIAHSGKEIALTFRQLGDEERPLPRSDEAPAVEIDALTTSGDIGAYHALAGEFQIVSARHSEAVAKLHDSEANYLVAVQLGEDATADGEAIDMLRTKVGGLASRLDALYAALVPARGAAEREFARAAQTAHEKLMGAAKAEVADAEAAIEAAISPLLERFYAAKFRWHRAGGAYPAIEKALAPMPQRQISQAAEVGAT